MFAAESEIDSRLLETQSPRHNHHTAANAITPESGRSTSPKTVDDEDTPLLSRTDDDVAYVGDNIEDEGPSWSGERDFEGKTWWNRPSVSTGFHYVLQ